MAPITERPVCGPKRRSFKALPNEIANYVSTKRKDPLLSEASNEKDLPDVLAESRSIDFIWVMCCSVNQTVPNWTGFNTLLHDEGVDETIQTVTYLPAIDQSPTKPDTVLEMLLQTKEKAEKLGLLETDLVVDQAIYAKAVEILSNPLYLDLKRFIVLRMGAFHITTNFISVIGKRFGDAGIKDILVESNIFRK